MMERTQTRAVNQAAIINTSDLNPNATRYGWSPFKEINLTENGTIKYYVQPMGSPYHHELPKNELIAFETFTIETKKASNLPAVNGQHSAMMTETQTKTAFEALDEMLSTRYVEWGLTALNSLQGLSQDDAGRIFRIVMPYKYSLGQMESELMFADERIDADTDINLQVDELHPENSYILEPLRNEGERNKARNLVLELQTGASIAAAHAQKILDETNTDITNAMATGKGKKAPDGLDKYVAQELGVPVPRAVGGQGDFSKFEQKLDYVVGREQNREQSEEIARLKAENAALKAGQAPVAALPEITEKPVFMKGELVVVNGETGEITGKPGGRITVKFDNSGESQTFEVSQVSKL